MKRVLLILFLIHFASCQHKTETEIEETVSAKTITYGSAIRLQNVLTKFL